MQEFIPDNDGRAFKRKMPKIKVHEREEVPLSIGHDDQHLPYPHLGCQPLEQFIQTSTAGTIISTPHLILENTFETVIAIMPYMMKSEYDLEVYKVQFNISKSRCLQVHAQVKAL
jgi:hypothetical protein